MAMRSVLDAHRAALEKVEMNELNISQPPVRIRFGELCKLPSERLNLDKTLAECLLETHEARDANLQLPCGCNRLNEGRLCLDVYCDAPVRNEARPIRRVRTVCHRDDKRFQNMRRKGRDA